LLFAARTGKQLGQSNILRKTLQRILAELKQPKCGAHALRRFRAAWLRKNRVPEDLITFWVAQAGKTVTEDCWLVRDDVALRKEVVEEAGLGFQGPSEKVVIGPHGTQNRI
jgi:integrase